jgi:hypothetical protein
MHYKSKHPDNDPPTNVQNIASLERWEHDPENSSDVPLPTFGADDLDSDGEEQESNEIKESMKNIKATESEPETIEDDDVNVIKVWYISKYSGLFQTQTLEY